MVVVKRYDVQYDPFSHSLLLLRRYEIFACYVQGLGRNMTLCEKVELLFFFKKATKDVDRNNNYSKTDLIHKINVIQSADAVNVDFPASYKQHANFNFFPSHCAAFPQFKRRPYL